MTTYIVTVIKRYIGVSFDARPSGDDVPEGSELHVVDTGEEYIFHDGIWVLDLRRINAIRMASL